MNRICPVCNKEYKESPAISRRDNKTAICPLCGTKEALESLGLSKIEIDKIISTIPKYSIEK